MALTKVILKSKPDGLPAPSDFDVVGDSLDTLQEGMVHVKTLWLSLDPYMNLQIAGTYITGPINPGDMMQGEGVAEVLGSKDSRFQPGDMVIGHVGWRQEAVLPADGFRKVQTRGLSPSLQLGVLGMPGLTGYAGAMRLAALKPGMTALAAAAAGPVGSTVLQLARQAGCRTVAISGSDAKLDWLEADAKIDETINYKNEDIRAGIARTCPDGVDFYFDNVGGDILQAAMEQLAVGGQVVLCGLIGHANAPTGPHPGLIIKARATVRGLVVFDHAEAADTAADMIADMIKSGDFALKEDITEGLENAPTAFARLLRGETFGKTLVKLA